MILWQEMRTGKTRSALHAYNQLLNDGVVDDLVVVTVATAMETWRTEVEEMGLAIPLYTCYGQTRQRMRPELPGRRWEKLPRIYVLNWEILPYWQKFFHAQYKQGRRFALVLDEMHLNCRNPSNQRFKAARWLSRFATHTWGLTGTLYGKSGMDVYWQLMMLGKANPHRWMEPEDFGKEFCNRRFNQYKGYNGGWEYVGLKNEEALTATLPCVSHLKMDDVADLPLPEHFPRWVANWGDSWLANRTDLELAREIQEMIPKKAQLTIDYVKQIDVRPVVVFGWNVKFTELVAEGLKAPRIYGSTSIEDRAKIRQSFQAGRTDILVGNYRSLGMGISLSRADDFVYGEPYWMADLYLQAQARGRDLRKQRALRHHHLLVRGSPDEYIWVVRLQRGKAIERLERAAQHVDIDLHDEEAM
jgi:superfamily II DNA or RNA helicase